MQNRQRSHMYSTYFAPRGHKRMYTLGMHIAQMYLSPEDRLIGVVGEAGSGKSALIRGIFPGLELTNDDDGINVRPLPLLEQDQEHGFFTPHTYHVDIRFENAFTQMSDLADAILMAIKRGKRVIIEHFDLIYPILKINADLLIGVGEEILITRPNLFGPEPQEISKIVYQSLPYRLMAHTAEDLCEFCMPKELMDRCKHDDVRHGFVLTFQEHAPELDIPALEEQVLNMIGQNLAIAYKDENHIFIGDQVHACTGPRIHVRSTGQIHGFHLLPHFIYDTMEKRYLLVGCVGEHSLENLKKLDEMNAWMIKV